MSLSNVHPDCSRLGLMGVAGETMRRLAILCINHLLFILYINQPTFSLMDIRQDLVQCASTTFSSSWWTREINLWHCLCTVHNVQPLRSLFANTRTRCTRTQMLSDRMQTIFPLMCLDESYHHQHQSWGLRRMLSREWKWDGCVVCWQGTNGPVRRRGRDPDEADYNLSSWSSWWWFTFWSWDKLLRN